MKYSSSRKTKKKKSAQPYQIDFSNLIIAERLKTRSSHRNKPEKRWTYSIMLQVEESFNGLD